MVTATAITNTRNLNHGRQNGLANAQCAWPSLVERGGAGRREKALGAFALPCALWLGAADHLGQATTTIAHATAMAGSRAHTARRLPAQDHAAASCRGCPGLSSVPSGSWPPPARCSEPGLELGGSSRSSTSSACSAQSRSHSDQFWYAGVPYAEVAKILYVRTLATSTHQPTHQPGDTKTF